jgi:hypothetical protein
VGVRFEDAREALGSIEDVLAAFPDVVLARMNIPHLDASPEVASGLLTLVVRASTDQMGALAGRLGMLKNVRVKSVFLEEAPL